MAISENVYSKYVFLAGDRVNLACKLGFLWGVTSIFTEDTPSSMSLLATMFSVGLGALTSYGIGTYKAYKKTSEHINELGRIDERFFRTIVKKEDGYIVGACQIQGMYLAAKRHGSNEMISDFYRMKKEFTKNIVPNF